MDYLENLEPSLFNEIKKPFVYIAGYLTRNDNQFSECETHFYYEKYGKYANLTDHGKLKVPSDCCIHIYTDAMITQTDAGRKTHEERKQEGRRMKTSLQLYLPLILFVRFDVWKGVGDRT